MVAWGTTAVQGAVFMFLIYEKEPLKEVILILSFLPSCYYTP